MIAVSVAHLVGADGDVGRGGDRLPEIEREFARRVVGDADEAARGEEGAAFIEADQLYRVARHRDAVALGFIRYVDPGDGVLGAQVDHHAVGRCSRRYGQRHAAAFGQLLLKHQRRLGHHAGGGTGHDGRLGKIEGPDRDC